MIADSELRRALSSLMKNVEVPNVPVATIRERMKKADAPNVLKFHFAAIAAAAAIAVVASLPMVAPGFMQTLEGKIAEILQWTPPPAAPKGILKGLQTQTVDLKTAQKRVSFTIVEPVGLPSDASAPKIAVAKTGVYSRSSHAWHSGPAIVTFSYMRRGGGSFSITAQPVSAQSKPPSKYMFEDRGVNAAGDPVLVKHERFTWRNGDQIVTAFAGEGITASEIVAIREAMHGVPVREVWPPARDRNVLLIPAAKP